MSEQLFKSPIRYSGYRINLLPQEQQRDVWEARLRDIQPWLPYIQEALEEPLFADDYIYDMPFDQLIKQMLLSGELFGCVHEDKVVAFVVLRDIKPGREAWLEGWVHPAFRGKYPCAKQMNQIIEYAFRPWNPEQTPSQRLAPRGLGLRKLKSAFSGFNAPAGRALKRLGFHAIGVSMMDGLFKGRVTDIILVEKFNQLYLPRVNNAASARQELPPIREQRNERAKANPTGSSVHTGSSIPERAELPNDPEPDEQPAELVHTPGPKRGKHSRRGTGSRRAGANPDELGAVAEPPERSNGRGEHGASGELLQADPIESGDSSNRVKSRRKRAGLK